MIRQRVATAFLRATRWSVEGERPDEPKFVLIAAPHTTNWDLLYMLAVAYHFDVDVSWLAKHSLFKGPIGWFLRKLGGIPVRRGANSGMVNSLAEAFADADRLVIVVPPEATRKYTDHWKSGFYRIAMAADVPVVCSFLDYPTRTGGVGTALHLSGDVDADMRVIRKFYAGKRGKYPANEGDVILRPDLPPADT